MVSATDEIKKKLGSSLQSARKKAGFKSSASFAEYMGISKDTYTGYEQGRISMSFKQAWQFADALHCTLDELGGRIPPKIPIADPLKARMLAAYDSLSDSGKEAAAGAVAGIGVSERVRSGEDCG